MREFSKVSPTIWKSQKFKRLPDLESRHVYLYLLSCPHGNSSGCFDLHPMYAAADLDMLPEVYAKAIGSICEVGLIEFDKAFNTVRIVNWEAFNEPTNPKHAHGLLVQLRVASSEVLRGKAFHAFLQVFRRKKYDTDASLRKAIDSYLKAYPEPIATETRDQDQTKTKTETRPDQTRPETRETSSRSATRPLATLPGGGLSPAARDVDPETLYEALGGTLPAPKAQSPPSAQHLLETSLMRRTA
jgi:hypothetical protein